MFSLKDLYENKNQIIDVIKSIVDKNNYIIDYGTIVGSSIYEMYPYEITDKVYNDLDILIVIKNLNTIGSKNIKYNYKQYNLDIQLISTESYIELLKSNHMFYIESLFTPQKCKLFDNNIKYNFEINKNILINTTDRIILETLNKANNLFLLYEQTFDDMLVVHANKLVWHAIRTKLMNDLIVENKKLNNANIFNADFYKIANLYWKDKIDLTMNDLKESYSKILPKKIYDFIFTD